MNTEKPLDIRCALALQLAASILPGTTKLCDLADSTGLVIDDAFAVRPTSTSIPVKGIKQGFNAVQLSERQLLPHTEERVAYQLLVQERKVRVNYTNSVFNDYTGIMRIRNFQSFFHVEDSICH